MTIHLFRSASAFLIAVSTLAGGPALATGDGCASVAQVHSDFERQSGARITVIDNSAEVIRAVIFMAKHGGPVPVLPDSIIIMQAPLKAEAALVVGSEACIKVQAPPALVETLRRVAKDEPLKNTI